MNNKVFENCEYTQRGFALKEFKDPGFSLHDIIKAAQQLDSIISPQNMIKEPPQKQLQMGI